MTGARSKYDVRMRLVCTSLCTSTSVSIGRIPRCAEERVVVLIKCLWTRWLQDENQGIRLNDPTRQPGCSFCRERGSCEVRNNFLRKREHSNTRMLFALVPRCSDWGTWETPLRMLFFHAHTNHVLATEKKTTQWKSSVFLWVVLAILFTFIASIVFIFFLVVFTTISLFKKHTRVLSWLISYNYTSRRMVSLQFFMTLVCTSFFSGPE